MIGRGRSSGLRAKLLISDEYLALQRELHGRGHYGISAGRWAKRAMYHAQSLGCRDMLDYGCGQGQLREALLGTFPVREYDPALEGKDLPPDPADMVYCGDVLEHIEPDHLDAVLDDLKRLARTAVFLVVATIPAQKKLADGRNAHLIVQPFEWWLPQIRRRWIIDEFSGRPHEFSLVGLTI